MPTDLERRHGLRRQAAAVLQEAAGMRGHMRRLEKAGDARAAEMRVLIDANVKRAEQLELQSRSALS
jgi:hypothetical protein